MNEQEVIKILAAGENETIEFKEVFDKEAIETATAFTNTRGGAIFVGVSDSGKIKGVQIGKEMIKNWANQISQSSEPRIIPEIETHEIAGKSIVIIGIKEFPIKPVSAKGKYF